MRLETADRRRLFTLAVDRYEHPDEELGPNEDNPAEYFDPSRFLIVSHQFRTEQGSWTGVGPTMTTYELRRLALWLESLRDGKPTTKGVYFTERDLELTVDDDGRFLRVHVFRDFLPSWASGLNCVVIEFPLAEIDLGPPIASLMRMLQEFPERPPIDFAASPSSPPES